MYLLNRGATLRIFTDVMDDRYKSPYAAGVCADSAQDTQIVFHLADH